MIRRRLHASQHSSHFRRLSGKSINSYATRIVPGTRICYVTACFPHNGCGHFIIFMKPCATPGCNTAANFALPGKPAVVCQTHILPGMMNVNSRKCNVAGCAIQPSYAAPGSARATRCKGHASPDMINVKSRKCSECDKRASFNLLGKKSAFCRKHKKPGMIDVTRRLCQHAECTQRARFGNRFGRPVACHRHRTLEMMIPHKKRDVVMFESFNRLVNELSRSAPPQLFLFQ